MNRIMTENAEKWENLYRQGLQINYPSDVFVSITHHLLAANKHKNILDYGFGTGANMLHLICRGFKVVGVEVSKNALYLTKEKLREAGFETDLKLLDDGIIPYEDGAFDVVIAWAVLYYNDLNSLAKAVSEIDRVLNIGGIFLGTMLAPGDISHVHGRPLGNCLYESTLKGREGIVNLIVDKEKLYECFPERNLEIGICDYSFQNRSSRHWIVSYEKKASVKEVDAKSL